ncbi:MAG: hypothetical protein FJ263_08365, partial [Planctomycetes bacterium]|nr:hypothetical protein [Planctomycetota bacterium]
AEWPKMTIELAKLQPLMLDWLGPDYVTKAEYALRGDDVPWLPYIGITAEHFCLQAAEEGLGTCMLGWFNEKKVMKLFSVPKFKRIELVISVGYSADEKTPRKNRKTTDEMVSYNHYC